MSAKLVPTGISFKRKRETSSGGAITTATFYSADTSKAAKPSDTSAESVHHGEVWYSICKELTAAKQPIPPPSVIAQFREIHLSSLTDYKGAQASLQKSMATNDLFAHSSSNDAIPSVISNHLKLPTYQLVKSASGVDEDPWVVAALETAVKDLATVMQSATKYLGTVYTVQVEHCKTMITASSCADRFAAKLTEYSELIIGQAGSADLQRWAPCIVKLKAAFRTELEDLNFEFCACQRKMAVAKETKATAMATARADAEMIDAMKPVGELISDEVKRQLALVKSEPVSFSHPTPLVTDDFFCHVASPGHRDHHEEDGAETRSQQRDGFFQYLRNEPQSRLFIEADRYGR